MPDLLRIKKSEPLKVGGYVRIKRGKYSGDLAQIEEVETNGLEVTLKVVPRLDYGLNENDADGPRLDPRDAKRKRAAAAKNAIPIDRPLGFSVRSRPRNSTADSDVARRL